MFNKPDKVSSFFFVVCVLTFVLCFAFVSVSAELLNKFKKYPVDYIQVAGRQTSPSTHLIPEEWLSGREKEAVDPAMVISVESLLQKLSLKEDIFLVDVRSKATFEKLRIPDSINIPLHALKTKNFLRKRPLVLINEGFEYLRLEQECLRLQKQGFKEVKILEGGLRAWLAKGGPVIGDVHALQNLNRVPPEVYFREKNNGGVLVVDVSNFGNGKHRSLIPGSILVPFEDEDHGFSQRLKAAIRRQQADFRNTILIFNDRGEDYERIEKQIQDNGIGNIFFLENGFQGYEKYLRGQALISRPGKQSIKAGIKCPTCP